MTQMTMRKVTTTGIGKLCWAIVVQASLLSEALVETRLSYLRADAYREAWARGEAWQEAILSGLILMPDNGKLALANALGVTVDRLARA